MKFRFQASKSNKSHHLCSKFCLLYFFTYFVFEFLVSVSSQNVAFAQESPNVLFQISLWSNANGAGEPYLLSPATWSDTRSDVCDVTIETSQSLSGAVNGGTINLFAESTLNGISQQPRNACYREAKYLINVFVKESPTVHSQVMQAVLYEP